MNLSAPISYPDDTTEMQRIESEEFREMLTTCLLTAEMNMEKPNTAVRRACIEMFKRFKGIRSKKIAYVHLRKPCRCAIHPRHERRGFPRYPIKLVESEHTN